MALLLTNGLFCLQGSLAHFTSCVGLFFFSFTKVHIRFYSWGTRVDKIIRCKYDSLTFPYIPLHSLTFPYIRADQIVKVHVYIRSYAVNMIPLHSLTFPYIPLHYLIFPYIPLHSLTFPYIPLHSLIFPYIPLYSLTFPYIPLHSLILPYIPLYSLTFPYNMRVEVHVTFDTTHARF